MFLKNDHKKLFLLQNVMKKLYETHYSLEKKLSASLKNGNPPDKKIMVRPSVNVYLVNVYLCASAHVLQQ